MIRREPSSFRDPSGTLYFHNNELFRQINKGSQEDYDLLLSSGLYDTLARKKKIVAHQEVNQPVFDPDSAYRIIKPERIRFITYPYEWSFSQLKDAALLTLNLQKEALTCSMTLKDASAYNIQFHAGHPILIDTLSFTRYHEGDPWVAYKQFCQFFLAPLALMSLTDVRLGSLLRIHIDGVPLDLASNLLPASSRLNPGITTHIHLHAAAQKRVSPDRITSGKKQSVSSNAMLGLIENLEHVVRKLRWKPQNTDWVEYYESTNYTDHAFDQKKAIIRDLITELSPGVLIDAGANTGIFSRQALHLKDCLIISADIDPAAVERNYLQVREQRERNLLPLLIDLTNPSPAIGWHNEERISFLERTHADVVMALALIHHLAISNNVPLSDIASLFTGMADYLILEFVPKEDSQVQRLLATREDIFPNYRLDSCKEAFGTLYDLVNEIPVPGTQRTILLMQKRKPQNDRGFLSKGQKQ